MNGETRIHSLDLIRRIRDAQARQLSGKSNADIIAFFQQAGERARRYARKYKSAQENAKVK